MCVYIASMASSELALTEALYHTRTDPSNNPINPNNPNNPEKASERKGGKPGRQKSEKKKKKSGNLSLKQRQRAWQNW